MIFQPEGYTAADWCNSMIDEVSQFGQAPTIRDDDEWQDWALAVLSFPGIAAFNPPSPLEYDNWIDWVHNFNLVVRI